MSYNMDMANLPARTTQKSISDEKVDQLVRRVARGEHPRDIARRIYPNHADRGKRQALYLRLRNLFLRDERIAQGIADEARLAMMVNLVPTVEAMAGRAKRGRVDAGKLILEATGFHNPKVQHQHSGEIKVKLDIPRPKFDGEVTDAEVVE